MKFSKLLVLSAFCLVSAGASAELVNGVRQYPAVTEFAEFQPDQVFYLYNVQARRFFVGANDYNTRASVATNGYKVKFVNSPETAPEEGVLEFTDSVETQKAWKSVFATADGGAIWVDNATETYRFWNVAQANGAYRISNHPLEVAGAEVAGKFLGWNGSAGDTRMYFVDPAAEGAGVDWQFVTEETYNAYAETWAAMKDQFEAAAELKTYLDAAKEQGIDVAAEQAIYENEAATVEELKAALAAVQKKINEKNAGNASVANPADMTASILNPTFENASYEGWKGTAPNMTGSGAHGPANVAEHYNKTFDTYQDLASMPKGVYMLSANAAFRTTWEDHANHTNYVARLYGKADNDTLDADIQNFWDAMNTEPMAGDTPWGVAAAEQSGEHDGVTYYIPNDPSAGRLYFEKGYYKSSVFFALEGDDPIRVGVMKKKNVTGSDWVIFDNFALTYYGNAPEAYQFWINQTPKTDYSETQASQQYKDAYEAAFSATASNKAEAVAAMKAIQAAADSISKNVTLWNHLKDSIEVANSYTVGDYGSLIPALDLGDYVWGLEDELNADADNVPDWTNEKIQEVINTLSEMIEAVKNEAKNNLKPGDDVTFYMTNPDFENGATGWTIVSKGGGNVQLGGNSDNHCYEAWHSTNFDIYQEVKGLPVGVYAISVQGYVRYKDGTEAIASRAEEPETVPIYVYMNDSKTQLASWFSYPKPESFYQAISGASFLSEDENNAYPDNMIAASAAFADGGYMKSASGLVANAGDVMRVGVKGTPKAEFWPIFDNFKLTYMGFDIDVVKPVLEEAIADAAKYESELTTKAAKEAFTAAYADAQAKVSSTDGAEMFRALAALTKAISAVEEGMTACSELSAAIENLMTVASESSSAAATEAMTWAAEEQAKLEACSLEKEDIEADLVKIREYLLKMQLPEGYEQGNGADVTAFIQTPGFSKTVNGGETNSIDGWQGTAGYNFGNDDTQKGALALEFYEKDFDMYQDVEGVGSVALPDGNYKVTVNAFERVAESTPAFFYAQSGEAVAEVEVMKLADGVDEEAGEVAPNDMVSAAAAFENGKYLNELTLVVSGGKLRVGIKHESHSGSDWIIMDNFKLYYYANDNTAVETLVNLGKVVDVQYFTLDGRRVNGAQKGITIRKAIMDNGAVIVKKIRK